MERNVNGVYLGGCRALGRNAVPQFFDDRGSYKAVVSPCFFSEPKETKEEERGKDSDPSKDLMRIGNTRIRFQRGPGDLVDARKILVDVCPGSPGFNA